ncbi:MAG: transposon-transfer assisting family protein [Oscillospiraceae bacterium]|nr:transposon-transfer assisting family protein [Oscillospiraceae bacterium]
MKDFTNDEMNLMCIYNTGTRSDLIAALTAMQKYLEPDETELRSLTDSTLAKLKTTTDAEFAELELYPDFDLNK